MRSNGRKIGLLVAVFVTSFAVAVAIVRPWHSHQAGRGAVAGHSWAYLTETAFVLMRGSTPVVRIPELSAADDRPSARMQWSSDGRYVTLINDALVRQRPDRQVKLIVVNTSTGAQRLFACSGCRSIVSVGDHELLASSEDYDTGATTEVLYDLASGQHRLIDLKLPPVRYSVWEPFAGAGQDVLVNTTLTSGLATQQALLIDSLDGSTQVSLGSYDANTSLLGFMSHEGDMTTATVGLRSHPGECIGTVPVDTFSTSSASTQVVPTSFLAAQPAGTTFGQTSGYTLNDLWRDADGSTWATVATWTCNNAARDETSKKIVSRHSSLWRLAGDIWQPATISGAPETVSQARQIDRGDIAMLSIPDCMGPKSLTLPIRYCTTGNLTRVQNGESTRIAGDVLALSSPIRS